MPPDLPKAVRRHLEQELVAPRLLAWIELEPDGAIRSAGATSEAFRDALSPGSPVEAILPVLVGVLPLDGRNLTFRSVSIDALPPVDVHGFEADGATWVVLVDEGPRGAQLRAWIREANLQELKLQRQEGARNRLLSIALGLEAAAFEILGGTEVRLVSEPPPWMRALLPEAGIEARVDVRDLSDFAADFLLSAVDRPWPRGWVLLPSLPWTEDIAGQGPVTRRCLYGRSVAGPPFFVIRRVGMEATELSSPIQAGRDLGLHLERLHQTMEDREILLHCLVHDLANPLGATLQALELLEPLPEDQEPLRQTAIGEASRMRSIVDALLDVYRYETADLPPPADDGADVAVALHRIRSGLALGASVRHVDLRIEGLDGGGVPVRGEPLLLERVLQNLIENAVRVSPADSEVLVRVAVEGDQVVVSVLDSGPGIDPALREQVFRKLRSTGTGRGRLGLGLYFCRITAERWGGSIAHRNRPEGGSCFELRLVGGR